MLRITIIAGCVLALLAGSFVLEREPVGGVAKRRTLTAAPTTATTIGSAQAIGQRRMTPPDQGPPAEPASELDTTGLLQPPLSIDALLDELNTDLGTAAMPVDREEFAAALRTDRELRKSLID